MNFDTATQQLDEGRTVEVPLSLLQRDPGNVRGPRADGDLAGLARSIQHLGVLQPITVRLGEGHFLIVMGHRRAKAAKRAGLDTVPCLLQRRPEWDEADADSIHLRAAQLAENEQREGIQPMAMARALDALHRQGHSTAEIAAGLKAAGLSVSRPAVSNLLGLLDLPDSVQARIASRELTPSHGKRLRQALKLGCLDEVLDDISEIEDEVGESRAPAESEILGAILRVMRGKHLAIGPYYDEHAIGPFTRHGYVAFDWRVTCHGCRCLRTLTVDGTKHAFCTDEASFLEKQAAAVAAKEAQEEPEPRETAVPPPRPPRDDAEDDADASSEPSAEPAAPGGEAAPPPEPSASSIDLTAYKPSPAEYELGLVLLIDAARALSPHSALYQRIERFLADHSLSLSTLAEEAEA